MAWSGAALEASLSMGGVEKKRVSSNLSVRSSDDSTIRTKAVRRVAIATALLNFAN
jgi:hypothetical protein